MKIEKLPRLRVDPELQNICREITLMNKTAEEWSKVESSDMFQTQHYCGGYISEEQAFWFSY